MKGKVFLSLSIVLALLIGLLPVSLSAQSFADTAFEALWQRTDKPIADGRVARSWMWGPHPFTDALYEPYAEAPGGSRLVQYLDKSRMEINNPNGDRSSQWFVTNGLLVREMVDGKVQTGDASFETRSPAQETVAGDSAAVNPTCPTYASYTYLTWNRADSRMGQKATATLAKDGTVGDDATKGGYSGTGIAYYEQATGHNVPQVLWNMMNQSGLIYDGGYRTAKVIDWVFAMGYPISEPYWVRCKVAGVEQDILVQLFERRVLTYTPANAAGWQVEMGNVGLHYYTWRYGSGGAPPPPAAGCEGVPADENGSVTPKCGPPGTTYTFSAWGFTPYEKINYCLSDPQNFVQCGTLVVTAGADGTVTPPPLTSTGAEKVGVWLARFVGVDSNHTAFLAFRIDAAP